MKLFFLEFKMNELIEVNKIVIIVNGNLITTSDLIAENCNVEHKAVLQLIRSKINELNELGQVTFEMRHGYNNCEVEIANLNEPQSALLIAFMRNSEIVVKFKLALIKEFYRMRQELQSKQANLVLDEEEIARRYLGSVIENKKLKAQALIDAPKVEFVDKYNESSGLKGFRQVAKLLKANEKELRQFIVDTKIMYKIGGEWNAYAVHIEAGRFEANTSFTDGGHAFIETKFTPKGITWIAGLWAVQTLKYKMGD